MTTTTPDRAATKTSYHILRRVEATDPVPVNSASISLGVFTLVGKDITAQSREDAIRLYAAKARDQAPGTYVAIPSRSFVEKTVKVETTTTVKLA